MLRWKKREQEHQKAITELTLKICDLDIKLLTTYSELEKDLNEKYLDLDKALRSNAEKDRDELESSMSDWCAAENARNEAARQKHEEVMLSQKKHMEVVEQALNQQLTLLKDIGDCLKTISQSKLKNVRTVSNGSN